MDFLPVSGGNTDLFPLEKLPILIFRKALDVICSLSKLLSDEISPCTAHAFSTVKELRFALSYSCVESVPSQTFNVFEELSVYDIGKSSSLFLL